MSAARRQPQHRESVASRNLSLSYGATIMIAVHGSNPMLARKNPL